jgi:hypothetical protein
MDYEIDLDPTDSVILLTVTAETVTLELADEIYRHLSEATSSGGPYAAIYDLSAAKLATLPTDMVRSFAHRRPSIPMGRKHVVVGKEPHIFGLALLFQMCSESIGERAGFVLGRLHDSDEIREFQVVHSVEEAYEIVGVHPEDFTECLIWPCEWVSRQPTSPGQP